jgi:hypothetical protein
MGYDRQTSPFGTRLFLTCYYLFLLLNVLLHLNNLTRINKIEYEFRTISFGFLSLFIFSISFYGLWFANILIFCFIGLLFSLLLGTSVISMILILTINSNRFLSLKNSLYFAHNYLWLVKASTCLLRIISLSFSCVFNIIALWGIFHLCSCIEHRHDYWPYRKKTSRISHTIIQQINL